jgi:tripartite-type tricarboxylate transporter receptor subunit TctC
MEHESPLGRALWATALVVVVSLVIGNFARQPLFGSNGQATALAQPPTLWLAGTGAGGQAQVVARQAAGWLALDGQAGAVSLLPGASASATVRFFQSVHRTPSQLLVLTSTTLADIARDRTLPEQSALRLSADRATQELARAAPVAVLGREPLALAVPGRSPVRSAQQLGAIGDEQRGAPLFSLVDESWLLDNLAALVERVGVSGPTSYTLSSSPREAVLGLGAGQSEAVLTPRGLIRGELRSGRLRELAWPGVTPSAWVALVAASGVSPAQLAALRTDAHALCASSAWRAVLGGDGLQPVVLSGQRLSGFLRASLAQTEQLETLSASIVREP